MLVRHFVFALSPSLTIVKSDWAQVWQVKKVTWISLWFSNDEKLHLHWPSTETHLDLGTARLSSVLTKENDEFFSGSQFPLVLFKGIVTFNFSVLCLISFLFYVFLCQSVSKIDSTVTRTISTQNERWCSNNNHWEQNSITVNFQEPWKTNIWQELSGIKIVCKILQDEHPLARLCKINIILPESYKILHY